MKRWSACVAALVVLGMTSCMRGCNVGPPAKKCTDSSECDDRLSCYRGYCSSQSYIEADQKCRAAPACRELGACGAVTVESFLGADSGLECAAVDVADCRASKRCTERGACALSGVYCVAAEEEACKKSTRCETHEECKLEKQQCVRPWQECDEPEPPPHQPAWARTDAFEVDMKRLGGQTSPGAVRGAVVACEVEPTRHWPSRVRIRGTCTPGPTFGAGDTRLSFARANVTLDPGDDVAVIVQKENADAGADSSSFVRAVYRGQSPFQGGVPGETLVCHVVPNDVAKTFGLEAVAEMKKSIDLAKQEKPSRRRLEDLPAPLHEARRRASHAAVWVGWEAPELTAQLEAMAKVEHRWSSALDQLFADMAKKAAPPGETIALNGHEPATVKAHALVCGDALRARYGERAAGRNIGPDDCGLELAFENKAAREVTFSWSFGSIGPVSLLKWLTRSREGAHVIDAIMIDGRRDARGSKPDLAVSAAPGERVIVLVGGKERDPKLGIGNGEELTILSGYVSFGDSFEMRTSLAR